MKLIVGLGNPGKEYINTRHNVGFSVIDAYLTEQNWKKKFNSLYCEKVIKGEKVIFVKPTTFMNLSGEAVRDFVKYYKINIDDILVIHDDMDLELGTYKLKKNSGSGGHNGIKSIISVIGDSFSRLKIGVSHNRLMDTKDYVLGKFSLNEQEKIKSLQKDFNSIIDSFIVMGIEKTMNVYNNRERIGV